MSEWEGDVLNRVKRLEAKRKLSDLKEMETKLNDLMSQEKKDYIAILEITKKLGL